MLRPLGAAALALALGAGPAAADGKAIIDNLRATPANLLDLALLRMESLYWADGIAGGYLASVSFFDDQFQILAWNMEAEGSEPACKALLDRMKRLAGVDPETGWPDQPASGLASMLSFNTHDFVEFDIDPSYAETADSMMLLKASLGVAGDGKAVICSSPLLSTEVTYAWE